MDKILLVKKALQMMTVLNILILIPSIFLIYLPLLFYCSITVILNISIIVSLSSKSSKITPINIKEYDIINVHSYITLNSGTKGIPNKELEKMIVSKMVDELKKFVCFIDIEYHDKSKVKTGTLEVIDRRKEK